MNDVQMVSFGLEIQKHYVFYLKKGAQMPKTTKLLKTQELVLYRAGSLIILSLPQ